MARGVQYNNNRGGSIHAGASMFGDYWGKPRPRVINDTPPCGEVRILVPADPEKVKAYRESEEYRQFQAKKAQLQKGGKHGWGSRVPYGKALTEVA